MESQAKTQKELLRIKTSLRVVEGFCEIGAGGKCRLSLQQTRNAPQPPEATSKEQLSI
jgi:hypothetical protein